jgi:hypothetical protein
MANERPERTRIFSHITRSRFLHLEDSLDIGKIRLFIGEYQRGNGAQATAFHFLDLDDARPLCADLSWAKATDFVDFKGTANGGQPQSRVLKIKGPKGGKYWLEIANGPGQVIGEGAVKPAGDPEASISIALSLWEARALALAVIEYMAAWRVAALLGTMPGHDRQMPRSQSRHVDQETGEIHSAAEDAQDLFGPEPTSSGSGSRPERSQKAEPEPVEDKPTSFYELAKDAIVDHGLLDLVQELVNAPMSWHEKAQRLQAAMAA